MRELEASRTALATSLMRAIHSRLDPMPILDDQWGDRLIPEPVRAVFRQGALDRMVPDARTKALLFPDSVLDVALRASPAYADVVIRTRYTEDALKSAIAKGIEQYVIIGAGFDSFACRMPDYARQLNIYEVDHPATQNFKRQCLAKCDVAHSDAVHFVAADLSTEELGTALARSSFQLALPTFFSWLGVTMYLTREANLAALRAIASCAPLGSELVFTYLDESVFDADVGSESFRNLRNHVSSLGEPWLSGFNPANIAEQLRDNGLLLLEDLSGEQMVARYDSAGINGLQAFASGHIVHARVAA